MKTQLMSLMAAVTLVWVGGCNVVGFLGSPTAHEKKVPAEYDLRKTKSKILVFVDQPQGGGVGFHARTALDTAVAGYLARKARIDPENILASVDYAPSRVQAWAGLSPAQIGRKAGADIVLYIRIDRYELEQMHKRGYFNGYMATRSVLVDVASAKVLWPVSQPARLVRIKVELETGGRGAVVDRIMSGMAHCITRYFYDCPGPQFRWGDEQKEFEFDNWK